MTETVKTEVGNLSPEAALQKLEELKTEVLEPIANENEITKPAVDPVKLKLAEDNYVAFEKELKTKLYPVKINNDETLQELKDFLEFDAEWRALESLGVDELCKTFDKIKKVKGGMIFLTATETSALNFFMNKVQGKGRVAAIKHLQKVKALDGALGLMNSDSNKMKQLESIVDAARQGIYVDNTAEESKAKPAEETGAESAE